jgi:hypothetical protein
MSASFGHRFQPVAEGAVVEFEIEIHDRVPLLDAGVTRRIVLSEGTPVERFHLVVDAEKGVQLQIAHQLLPEAAVHRESRGNMTRVECDAGKFTPPKDFEFNLPPDVATSPYLSFSTGVSWQAVAARYSEIVDERVRFVDVKHFLEGVNLSGTPLEIAARLTAKLHKNVRYTGVEFGEAAIVPTAPTETLRRGYGDCKDKATLLVALLRAAGLNANVALLDSGLGTDIDADLPGMGVFNHAIVYLAADSPMWIDATAADMRTGFLPGRDQGRLALIADPKSTALLKTPTASTADNWNATRLKYGWRNTEQEASRRPWSRAPARSKRRCEPPMGPTKTNSSSDSTAMQSKCIPQNRPASSK